MKKASRRSGRIVHKNGTESDLERLFLAEWKSRYPNSLPIMQHQFHHHRQWRFDFCWPLHKVAVEIQGYGTGHTSLIGMTKDYDKHYGAMTTGWKIVYLTSLHLSPRRIEGTMDDIAKLLGYTITKQVGYVPIYKRTK